MTSNQLSRRNLQTCNILIVIREHSQQAPDISLASDLRYLRVHFRCFMLCLLSCEGEERIDGAAAEGEAEEGGAGAASAC